MSEPASEQSVFLKALALPGPGERAAYLDDACRDNPGLRAEVEALLAAHERLGGGLSPTTPLESPTAPPPGPRPEVADQAGAVLAGRYKLLERIGEGGMGTVWMAQQTEPVKRPVAVKLIKPGMDSRAVLARFEQERQALALMDHPNIAKVLDAGTAADGRPFFVMELVKGTAITKYCDQRRLTPAQRLELFAAVCQAVQHAHQKGVIHRDIKPSNVLVAQYDDRPVPKVIDFGVAKAVEQRLTEQTLHTGFGAVVGTLEYMSPEQASFNQLDVDTRSDIYSLGVLLYELLTGSPPLSRKELEQAGVLGMLRLIREQEPSKPSTKLSTAEGLPTLAANRGTEPKRLTALLRGELDWIVMKALEKNRERRYETALGFAQDVQRYLAGEPVLACPPSVWYRLRKQFQRHRGPLLAAAAVVLALTAGTVAATLGWLEARHQRDEAEASARKAEAAAGDERVARQQEAAQRRQAEAVAQLLESLFGGINPWTGGNRTAEFREVLADRLAQVEADLDTKYEGQPVVRVRLRNALGMTRLGLGDTERAVALLEAARAEGAALEGGAGEYGLNAGGNLANAYVAAGRTAEGIAILERLREPLAALPPENNAALANLVNLGTAYSDAGRTQDAIRTLEDVRGRLETRYGSDHVYTLAAMNSLALAYVRAGRYAESIALSETVSDRLTRTLGPRSPHTLTSRLNLAMAYQGAGQLDRALQLSEENLAAYKPSLGPLHPYTLTAQHNLAQVYYVRGETDKALALLEENVAARKAQLGANHPATLSSQAALAGLYYAMRRWDRAIPLLDQLLAAQKATLGPDHVETLRSMGNLAECYRVTHKLDRAVALGEQILAARRAKLGPDHPDTLITQNNLGLAYFDQGKLDLARSLFEQTLAARKARLGADHPDTLRTMNCLAQAYKLGGELDRAAELFQLTLAGRKATLGADHPDTLLTMGSLGLVYARLGRFAEARPLFEAEVAGLEKRLGLARPETQGALGALAALYERQGVPGLAEARLRDLVAALRRSPGPESPAYTDAVDRLGRCLLAQRKYPEAEAVLRDSAALRQRTQADSWTTYHTRSMLGGSLLGQKKYAEAEPLLIAGHEGLKARAKAIPPESAPCLTESVERLVALYEATDRKDDAARWRKELDAAKAGRTGPGTDTKPR
jgi:tetratricopeptide (TPR) repeat protein